MARYEKQVWLDHIVDEETGEIIQQGTVHSQQRMNHMEEGIYSRASNEQLISLEEDFINFKNSVTSDITGNPHVITFENLEGVIVEGYWNNKENRLEVN